MNPSNFAFYPKIDLFNGGPDFIDSIDGREQPDGGESPGEVPIDLRDLLLFHEYFHAETGEGLGASHKTGWTPLVAILVRERRETLMNVRRPEPAVGTTVAVPY